MALLAPGALGVHELRYLFAYGGDAQRTLDHQGHAYLAALTPLVSLLLAGALARLLVGLASGRRGRPRGSWRRLWAAATGALVAIYCCQELLEGSLSAGHPGGLAGVFGHGGWLAFPLAVVAGLLVGVALRLGEELTVAAVAAPRPALRRPAIRVPAPATGEWVVTAPVLARHLAGRAPPLAS